MKKIIIYPFIFALFPVISLYQANTDQITFVRTLSTIALVLCATAVLWGGLYLVYHSLVKSAILASVVLFLFFSFGHLFSLVMISAAYVGRFDQIRPLIETRTAQAAWLALGVLVLVVFAWRLYRSKGEPEKLHRLLTFVSLALVGSLLITGLAPLFTKMPTMQVRWNFDREKGKTLLDLEMQPAQPAQDPPDIYYIILDGYGRQDVLEALFGIDNGEFVSFLEQHGFYVAERASTNYMQTHLSLSSSLNMQYLDQVAAALGERTTDITSLAGLIESGHVVEQLRGAGYTIVNFSNSFPFTDIQTADVEFSPAINPDSFQMVLINNTPLSIFLLGRQYGWHRQRILYALEHLPDAAAISEPTFVFAHILAPHPPFVLGPQGEPIYPPRKYSINDGSDFYMLASREEYVQGYSDQLQFVTGKIQEAIEQILARSPEPPVIILQADHGPGSYFHFGDVEQTNLYERGSILSAYSLPKGGDALLYPEISPVNSFRVVFNHYLGTHYPLLDDRSYYSTHDYPLLFIDVSDRVEARGVTGAP
jgi:hypothetical protein